MDCSPPRSSVHGIFQARILERVAIWLSGKESACNAGNPGSIPGSGRSPGEGIGYPLQYSWASLLAQMVTNPPATQETWVWSLGWEDPLEEGTTTHSSILAWKIPWTEAPCGLQSMGSQRVRHNRATKHSTAQLAISPTCWISSIHFTGYQQSHGPENLYMKFRTKSRCNNRSHNKNRNKRTSSSDLVLR